MSNFRPLPKPITPRPSK